MSGERGGPSTKPPPFDPAAYAEASEQKLRANNDVHTRVTSERKVPSLGARPHVIMSADEIAGLELSDQARNVLQHLDGETAVHTLMEAKLVDVDNLFDALDELEHEGVIVLSMRRR